MSLPESNDETVLLHNPRCSKSRATAALLEERSVAFVERCYLEAPLTREELEDLRTRLGRAPKEWVRSGEAEYAQAGLSADSSDEEIFDAMVAHPILMERPIVVHGGRAMVGRPPEQVLDMFE